MMMRLFHHIFAKKRFETAQGLADSVLTEMQAEAVAGGLNPQPLPPYARF